MPQHGDMVVLSDEVKAKWLTPEMTKELRISSNKHIRVYTCIENMPGIYEIVVMCGIVRQTCLVKSDGSPAWVWGSFFGWPVFYWPDERCVSPTYDLKEMNTAPNATHCVKCGGRLKDPGLGPTYKHCPVCEP